MLFRDGFIRVNNFLKHENGHSSSLWGSSSHKEGHAAQRRAHVLLWGRFVSIHFIVTVTYMTGYSFRSPGSFQWGACVKRKTSLIGKPATGRTHSHARIWQRRTCGSTRRGQNSIGKWAKDPRPPGGRGAHENVPYLLTQGGRANSSLSDIPLRTRPAASI